MKKYYGKWTAFIKRFHPPNGHQSALNIASHSQSPPYTDRLLIIIHYYYTTLHLLFIISLSEVKVQHAGPFTLET